ncbi:MAG: M23 family metallopeptidase [Candidatus Gracilibacteria bacterium]|nr:M23 family metallopeptidase [Candidatus Gracilibacteria bacterium]
MLIYSRFLLGVFCLLLPLTLHSTDILHSSNGNVRIRANLNPNVVLGDPKLDNTILVITAPTDKKDIHIVSDCEHQEATLYKTGGTDGMMTYVMQLSFLSSCESPTIRVGDSEGIFTDTIFTLPLHSLSEIRSDFINTKSPELLTIMGSGQTITGGTGVTIVEKLRYIQMLYENLDTALKSNLAGDIIHDREDTKYTSPVAGYVLPSKNNLIPGAGRPYRRDTTDGIHHGWDILAPYGTPVQALAKGQIIRIVNNWTWDHFALMGKGPFSADDKLRNLDIFRGNQVWLQSMDGNVTFYSHLSKISPDMVVGTIVDKGTYLGDIGMSGVPDKNYKDFHLHFEIQQNPFHEDMRNPNYLDIMRWEYIGKGAGSASVHEKMKEIFE